MPKKTLSTKLLTLEKYVFVCSYIYHFLLFFFTVNNEHIQKDFLKYFVLAFNIPFTFLKIMKALVLVEHI